MGNKAAKDNSKYGYRVVKVVPNSPAKQAGLVEFLDYIIDISIPGTQASLSGNYGDFFKTMQECEDKEATLKVYNILYRKVRTVTITPSKKWENADSLLGALVRYEEYATAYERVLRIAQVHPNSPASAAELEAENDFLLGSPQYLYTDLNELANFIEMTQENDTIKSLELYLYNAKTNSVRSTLIIPNKNWGGRGYLGCEFGLGILNNLPELEDKDSIPNKASDAHGDERLDEDDAHKTSNEHGKILTHSEANGVKNIQGAHKTEHIPEQENPEDKMPDFKLRSPSTEELDLSRSFSYNLHDRKVQSGSVDLSHELTNQRMKLLNSAQQHKVAIKPVSRPLIKSGKSTANPFNDGRPSNVAQSEGNRSIMASFDNIGSTDDLSHNISPDKLSSSPSQANKIQTETEKDKKPEPSKTQNVIKEESHAAKYKTLPDLSKLEEANRKQSLTNENQKWVVKGKSPKLSPSRMGSKGDLTAEIGLSIQENRKSSVGSALGDRLVPEVKAELSFFSKKLNGEYIIHTKNLFHLEELK